MVTDRDADPQRSRPPLKYRSPTITGALAHSTDVADVGLTPSLPENGLDRLAPLECSSLEPDRKTIIAAPTGSDT
jgi:hypothetical protein